MVLVCEEERKEGEAKGTHYLVHTVGGKEKEGYGGVV